MHYKKIEEFVSLDGVDFGALNEELLCRLWEVAFEQWISPIRPPSTVQCRIDFCTIVGITKKYNNYSTITTVDGDVIVTKENDHWNGVVLDSKNGVGLKTYIEKAIAARRCELDLRMIVGRDGCAISFPSSFAPVRFGSWENSPVVDFGKVIVGFFAIRNDWAGYGATCGPSIETGVTLVAPENVAWGDHTAFGSVDTRAAFGGSGAANISWLLKEID